MANQVTCKNCGETFERPVKRGRPHTKCEKCRNIPKTNPCLEIPEPKLGPGEKRPKPKSRFKDESVKGNARYSRAAFIEEMEKSGVPRGAKAVDAMIRKVRNDAS